jgi:uncharacterized protein (DUF3820 family)
MNEDTNTNTNLLDQPAHAHSHKGEDKVKAKRFYEDLDLMPFGKHRGERLQDVPASYFHWLWQQRPLSDIKLEQYIQNNLPALKIEHPDGIWS